MKPRRIAFRRIAEAAARHSEAICRQWLPGGRVQAGEYLARNPKRADHKPGSFSINLSSGCWADFATGDGGGDFISLAAYLFDINQMEAARRVAEMLGVHAYET
jgi:hypothetical protein